MGQRPGALGGAVIPPHALDWYRGRRVLVTGHTGFKGAWLAAWLHRLGAHVVGAALPPEDDRPSLFTAARLDGTIDSRFVDLRDADATAALVRDARPQMVFHLAAQSLVRRSYQQPVATFATNVMGTAHLLEAARAESELEAIVVVTSDKCYENDGRLSGYRESDPLGGHDPYSASKGCTELVAAAYRRSFYSPAGIPLATARAGNVIGGGDWSHDRLLPDLMIAAAADRVTPIRYPGAVRPWQHVLEALRGYLLLGRALVDRGEPIAQAWNFGPTDEASLTVGDLVRRLHDLWPAIRTTTVPDPAGGHEADHLTLDCRRAAQDLGWTPLLDLSETLEWTVQWYRDYYQRPADAPTLVHRALDAYGERIAGSERSR